MFCVYCNQENRSSRSYCAQCGASLVIDCAKCGFRNHEGEDYCGGCGIWVRPGATPKHYLLPHSGMSKPAVETDPAPARRPTLGRSVPSLLRQRFSDNDDKSSLPASRIDPINVGNANDAIGERETVAASVDGTAPETTKPTSHHLFGRNSELYVLRHAWLETCRGLGQVVLINGRDGMGKSRLITAVERLVGAADERELSEHVRLSFGCRTTDHNDPLSPFLKSFHHALASDAATGRELRHAIAECGRQSPNIASTLACLFPLTTAVQATTVARATSRMREEDKKASQSQLEHDETAVMPSPRELRLGAIQTLIERLADKTPLIISFEDIHWIDATSLELLTRLIVTVRTHPILLLISSRQEFPGRWHKQKHVAKLNLGTLDAAAARDLLAQTSAENSNKTLTAEQRDFVLAKAQGTPLLIEQFARACSVGAATGTSPQTIDDCIKAQLGDCRVNLHGVIDPGWDDADLDRTKTDDGLELLEVASVAAVIGGSFDIPILESISGHGAGVLRVAVGELTRRGVLERQQHSALTPAETDRYQFCHTLVQQNCYANLGPARRVALHAATARYLLSARENAPVATVVSNQLLGWHFDQANNYKSAAQYYELAALEAFRAGTFNELIKLAEICIARLRQSSRRADGTEAMHLSATSSNQCREARLWVLLGGAHRLVTGVAAIKTLDCFKQALRLATVSTETDIRLDANRGLFSCYFARGDIDEANELSQRTRTLFDSGDLTHGTEVVCYMEGASAFWSGRFNKALVGFSKAHAVLDQCDGTDTTQILTEQFDQHANVLGLLAWTQWISGETNQATASSRLALARAHASGQPLSLALTYFWIAATTICAGNTRQAKRLVHRTGELAKTNGIDYLRAVFSVLQGQVTTMAGDYKNGLVLMSLGLDQMNDCEAGVGYPWLLAQVATAEIAVGDIDAAEHTLSLAFERTELHGEHHWLAELYRLKGQTHARSGDTDTGIVWTQRAFDTARIQGARSLEYRAVLELSRLRGGDIAPGEWSDYSNQWPNRSADVKD